MLLKYKLQNIINRIETLEVSVNKIEAFICDEGATEGVESVITYVDLQQIDKKND